MATRTGAPCQFRVATECGQARARRFPWSRSSNCHACTTRGLHTLRWFWCTWFYLVLKCFGLCNACRCYYCFYIGRCFRHVGFYNLRNMFRWWNVNMFHMSVCSRTFSAKSSGASETVGTTLSSGMSSSVVPRMHSWDEQHIKYKYWLDDQR
jgi:hypothetical protein